MATDLAVGDRVQVRPGYDDTLRVLGMRTAPGTVSAIYEEPDGPCIVVDLDDGQGVPYFPHELVRVTDGARADA